MLSYKYLKCGVACVAGVGAVNLRMMAQSDPVPKDGGAYAKFDDDDMDYGEFGIGVEEKNDEQHYLVFCEIPKRVHFSKYLIKDFILNKS